MSAPFHEPKPLFTHPELGLPVYAEGDVTWEHNKLTKIAYSGTKRFLRGVRLQYRGPKRTDSLPSLLSLADVVFEEAADKTRTAVVPHGWGLAQLDPHSPRISKRHPAIPASYALVAAADIIQDARRLSHDEFYEMGDRVAAYEQGQYPSGHYLYDLGEPGQFVVSPSQSATFITDLDIAIEPCRSSTAR